jgi:hypothetical protein
VRLLRTGFQIWRFLRIPFPHNDPMRITFSTNQTVELSADFCNTICQKRTFAAPQHQPHPGHTGCLYNGLDRKITKLRPIPLVIISAPTYPLLGPSSFASRTGNLTEGSTCTPVEGLSRRSARLSLMVPRAAWAGQHQTKGSRVLHRGS